MPNKKTIITIVIAVVLIIIVMIAFKSFSGSSSTTDTTNNGAVLGAILPHGSALDFSDVKKFNKTDKLFTYPVPAPTDVGQPLNGLIVVSTGQ